MNVTVPTADASEVENAEEAFEKFTVNPSGLNLASEDGHENVKAALVALRNKHAELKKYAFAAGESVPQDVVDSLDALNWIAASFENWAAWRDVADEATENTGDLARPADHDSSIVNNEAGW